MNDARKGPARENSPAVVITGASTGIGAACALALDSLNYSVFAGVRSEADGRRLQQQASPRLVPVMIEVTDEGSVRAAADSVRTAVGAAGLAGLVNNAGIVVSGPLELLPLDEVRKQFDVNVIGTVAVIQAFVPLLRQARGRIVNIGSVNGRLAAPYLGPYSASKFALEAVTDSLRLELRSWGIRVSIVEPASVQTPIWKKSIAAADALTKEASAQELELYEADLDAMRRLTDQLAQSAMPAERVARKVVHALTARRPKTRYPVGIEARWAMRAVRWLPDRLRDRIVRRSIGLP